MGGITINPNIKETKIWKAKEKFGTTSSARRTLFTEDTYETLKQQKKIPGMMRRERSMKMMTCWEKKERRNRWRGF
uniref:Uncharacterized protein n=1 Tax=Nelumbo nucifera TaxID=4432 RepID=A0A822YGU5_NELNU|nr:TPA_asm: hypothetical protein HUJ06_009340 [Nelumbo nucifera]